MLLKLLVMSRSGTPHGQSTRAKSPPQSIKKLMDNTITPTRKKNKHSKAGTYEIEPAKSPEPTLVDHVNAAEKVMYDLRYVVKFMRNAAEAKRIQEEKAMAKEFEREEERKRVEFLKNLEKGEEEHSAATRISLLYRKVKALRMVREKRVQLEMEAVIKEGQSLAVRWIPFQKLFRQYSTRKWFAARGVKFNLNRKRKKKRNTKLIKAGDGELVITPDSLRERVNYERQQGRIMSRVARIDRMFQDYATVLRILELNTTYWVKQESAVFPLERKFIKLRRKYEDDHKKLSVIVAAQKATMDPQLYEREELKLKVVAIRIEGAEQRAFNCVNRRWWITQLLRANYRRIQFVKLRFLDSLKRIMWVSKESEIVSRIMFQIEQRLDLLKGEEDAKLTVEWLKIYDAHCWAHQATLDASQEAILLDETNRLERDITTTLENESLLKELLLGMESASAYTAERVRLDIQAILAPRGSEEAVLYNQRLYSMKMKLAQLNSSVIDTVKVGIQGKLTAEDEYHTNLVGFPNDTPELPISEMKNITATLLEPFHPSVHIKIEQFLDIYLLQPWQAALAVDDVRIEETIRTKEIALDRTQVELKGLRAQIQENYEQIAEIAEADAETNGRIGYYEQILESDGDNAHDDDVGGYEEIMQLLEELRLDVSRNKIEVQLKKNAIDSMRSLLPPIEDRIEKTMEDILQRKEKFQEALNERRRVCKRFFELESAINEELFRRVAVDTNQGTTLIAEHAERNRFVESVVGEHLGRVVEGIDVNLDELNALKIPLGAQHLHLQKFLAVQKPRTECSAERYLAQYVDARLLELKNTGEFLEFRRELLEHEEKLVSGFNDKKAYYIECVERYQASLLRMRRQRSFQRELAERKSKIADLRVDRLRMMRQTRDIEAAEKAAQALLDAERSREQEDQTVGKKLARALKKGIRGARDAVRNFVHDTNAGMTEEENQMAQIVRSRMKQGGGEGGKKQEGVRFVYITQGEKETGEFERQNEHLRSKGLPNYQRMTRALGDQAYLWYQMSYDPVEFVTHLELGHKDENHPDFRHDLRKQGYISVTHPKVNMIIWTKKDIKRARVVANFMISYTEAEEATAIIEGYDKIETSLAEFGLPDTHLWIQKVDRMVNNEALNTNSVIQEITKVRQLLKTKPDDASLLTLQAKLADKLQKAYHKEVLSEVTNPLQYAVELLNLNEQELEQWVIAFQRMDKDAEGKVHMDKMFEFLNVPFTGVFREVFHHVDAQDEENQIEFGDFMRACAIFGFFGKDEILKFMYLYADKEKIGRITHDQFIALLGELHPHDKTRAKRALKELVMVPGKEMDFYEFKDIMSKYPALPHPMENMQFQLRNKTMGNEWWVTKLRKYKTVRRKMEASGANIDEVAAIEMKRFGEDEARNIRMEQREKAIASEPSAVKRIILHARQIADELA